MNKLASSFRDPSGFVFRQDGKLYRQVNRRYQADYDLLMSSGLYQKLIASQALVAHEEVSLSLGTPEAYKVIEPQPIHFISYPYEWSFSQLKDAALLTLRIQREALAHGLTLKDASAYNIQFNGCQPIFIDTLSFEKYTEGQPWVAYKQFCEQFLAPLALWAQVDGRLGKLSQLNVEGVPLELAAKLLPLKAKFSPAIFLHIAMHAKSQSRHAAVALQTQVKASFSKNSFLGLLDNLSSYLEKLQWQSNKTVWTEYYDEERCVSYDPTAMLAKKKIVAQYLDLAGTKNLWDIGANAGLFSRLAAAKGIEVISMDYDQTVVEQNYLWLKKEKRAGILPLVIDLTNPSPAIGWHNRERESLYERRLPDTVLALALVHHLAIANNLPLGLIAEQFSDLAPNLIIEFVPKDDRQTQLLLQNREDIFDDYTLAGFEAAFSQFYEIKSKNAIPDSKRFLYLLTKRTG